jgi:acyl carrier protein
MNDVAQTTSLLDTLAGFFAQALGHPAFALSDSFFAVGGDSLGAADVLARVEETFHVELKFRDILEAPTPLRLALTILRARAKSAGHDLAAELSTLSTEDASRLLAHLQEPKP